jgi:NitT/TauT family transport system substrate-binding protein
MSRSLAFARTVAALAVLTGCGGQTPSPSAPVGGPERAAITVGLLPIVDVAPVHLAIERGLFADEGLTVTTELVQGGAAAIPALVSGDLDIAYGNWVSFLLANQEGIELQAIADGVAAAPGFTEILALPASGLEGNPAGLAGRTVAVNTLGNVGELAVRAVLLSAGVDIASVQLVEIPFPDMGAALERGDVDAIWASEPVPTIVKSTLDAVVVADSFAGDMDAFPVAGYQATRAFTAANPRTVAAFQRALAAAAALIADDPSLVADIVPTYTSLASDLASQIALPRYGGQIDASLLERVRDELVAFEMLEEGMDTAPLVLAPTPPE